MNHKEKIHSPWFFAYLMLTAVLCGGFVMVVEVLGSRVIGPFFGVGLFVWTSLIAVALLSLALGYWIAGYWADKREHPDYLFGIIIVGGLLVLLIPFLKGIVLELCMPLGLRWGAFTSTLLLFGPPLFVLGCVSPYLIKIATKEFHLIGRTVGRFYALSTLGSTVGTTATGFFLIANFRVDSVFVLSAAVEKAKRIMEREQALKLNQRDSMLLMDALDAPAKPNERLQEAAARYANKTQ